MLKIAHISLHIEYQSGIVRSRKDEALSGVKLKDYIWDVFIASPNRKYNIRHINYIPIFSCLSPLFESNNKYMFYLSRFLTLNFLILRICFNLKINRLSKKYDYVIVRYNSADLLAFLFLKRKNKLLFYHHCKPAEELKLYSKIAYHIENFTGRWQHKNIKAIVGVTPEIAEFESKRCNVKNTLVFPNGIIVVNDKIIDNRDSKKVRMIMLCGKFQAFHGYDLLLKCINNYSGDIAFEVDFYGDAYEDVIKQIDLTKNCFYKGFVESKELKNLFTCYDLGLGSLAFYRTGLSQAATIKVREYLANGLSVVVGHDEFVFPKDFKYIMQINKGFDFTQILEFGMMFKQYDKNKIYSESLKYIDQKAIIDTFIERLHTLK